MLYDGENPVVRILGVENMKWSGGFFRIAPRRYSALAFRIKGTAAITIGGTEYFVNSNDILYLPQNTAYTAQYSDTEMIVIHFLTEKDDSRAEVYSVDNTEEIYQRFLRAHIIWMNKEPGYSAYVMSQIYHILGQICEKETMAQLPSCFLNAISFINSNFKSNSVSIDSICENSAISATKFRILFKKHYQKTPIEYITGLRLEYARNLISNGVPIEKAALQSGFNDPKYFARTVKKHFGCTPVQLKTFGK